ncbi:Zinc finger bed domain-containing protein 4 [Plakobranchus ocellatus]|uniref:Zinc finger bed domain-containing protein 4 n=1 Tax=Plakobranchus ocellatus TaxID=259542 RepID=A0AAV4AJY7_9GAST|nr:Zinc finger bed domain-containing protein 4 [Plakobranchus ocellatus]
MELLKELPFFNPCNLVVITDTGSLTIPGIHDVPHTEILRYKESLGPRAVTASGGIPLDLTVFWNSVSSDLPHLSVLAKRYIYTCLNSADAERSFSIYNLVFSERRRRLSEANLKALVFLYYNSFISYEYIV